MNKIPAKYLGPLLILLGLLPILVYATQIRQLLFPRATYTGIPSRVLVNPGRIRLDVVSNVPLYLSALAVDTNDNYITTGVTYVWGISSTNSVGNLIVKDNTTIATFIAKNTGLGDIWVKAITSSGEATSSIPVCIGVPCPTAVYAPNYINWQVPSASVVANDIYIEISGHKFYGKPDPNTSISLGPAPTATTDPLSVSAQVQWVENGYPITLKLFFYRNNTTWWINAYSFSAVGLGEGYAGPLYIAPTPLGNPLFFTGSFSLPGNFYINATGLKLEAFTLPATAVPTPTPLPSPSASPPSYEFSTSVSSEGRAVRGDSNAPITMVEYLDFQCPFCKQAVTTLNQVLRNYSGIVKHEIRHFPLSDIHPYAIPTAIAFECVLDQNTISAWNFHDLVYARNSDDSLSNIGLRNLALQVGVDISQFDICFANQTPLNKINTDKNLGLQNNVPGTPTFFINSIPLYGAYPYQSFRDIIERILHPISFGDIVPNGHVDIFDYNFLIAEFGKSNSSADINSDGKVDIFDYNILVANFGK